MGDVEQPGPLAHALVLVHVARVAQRHLEARELDELGAGATMELVEGCAFEGLGALHVGSLDRKAHAS